MKITSSTKILGVVGYPIKHSLSPIIHNYLIEKFKLNWVYLCFSVKKSFINDFFKGISAIDNMVGFNITVPYKGEIIKHLKKIDKTAKMINAVNTVKIIDNNMTGYNTDDYGFIKSIEVNFPDIKIRNKNVLLLGAGGAGKAVAFALLKQNINSLVIMNRTYENGIKLKNQLKKFFKKKDISVIKYDYNLFENTDVHFDLIINSTSVGLSLNDPLLVDLSPLKGKDILVFDLIYNPFKTLLLKSALKNKLKILNGLDMLILQGLKSFSIWSGISLEKELLKTLPILRSILQKELKKKGK